MNNDNDRINDEIRNTNGNEKVVNKESKKKKQGSVILSTLGNVQTLRTEAK